MSLILEALKKLDREKQAGGGGFVVLSHLPWVGARSKRGTILRGLVVAAALTLAGAALWRWWSAPPTPGGLGAPAPHEPESARATAGPGPTPIPDVSLPSGAGAHAPTGSRPEDIRPAAPTSPAHLAGAETPEADAPAGSDPLAPATATPTDPGPPAPAAASAGLRLNAISVRDGHPVAILNDRLVREGDRFDGIRVLRIGETEVEVEVDGERRTLRF